MARKTTFLLFLLLLLLLAAACREDPTPPPPTAQATLPLDEAQPEAAGATAAPANPAPTVTIGPPPTATPLATSTAAAEPTPVHISLRSPDDFGDSFNPLTGEPVDDPSVLERRPLVVKISNAPAGQVRPQSGLNEADLVFEHVTEGGLTRFTILVYGQSPAEVGPIRSARLIDLELPAMYDAALVYSGSSDGVRQRLYSSDFRPRLLLGNEPGYFRTGADKAYEHTLYGKPELFWQSLEEKGLNTRPVFLSYMAFDDQPPPGGQPASALSIDFNWETVEWKYDPESGRYYRWADGQEHGDGLTGEQVNAANVVVIFASHTQDPNICEQVTNGVCVALSVEAQIWGTGPAVIFRDGQRYDVTWERINRQDMFTFKDANGQALPLQIGNSWMEVVPTWFQDPLLVTE